jgi:muramoyltetrapeptide carboxypeptidase
VSADGARTRAGRRRPRRLLVGDRVALVAPASPVRPDDLERGAAELRALGFEPVYDGRVLERHGYVAGLPHSRVAALADAWRDPSIRAVIAVRGGYGSQQLLPHLDPRWLADDPKVFVGLAAVTQPGPMGTLAPAGLEVLRDGDASGVLAGGTLTQLASLLGTPFAFVPREPTILFLEDVGERPYRIDRLLTQLHQAGTFRRVTGVVLGSYPGCDEAGGGPTARAVLRDLFAQFPGPVIFGFPSGHGARPTLTLPLGVDARLTTAAGPALSIEEAAVA